MKADQRSAESAPKGAAAVTASSFLLILFGLLLAVGNTIVLGYIVYYGHAPVALGISLLDGNSLIGKLWGSTAVIALGSALTVVALLGVVAGFWLRRSLRKGGRLGAALLPFYLFLGIGFEIPALYVFVPLMTVLLVLGWRALR